MIDVADFSRSGTFRGQALRASYLAILLAAFLCAPAFPVLAENCPEREQCSGCGCAGGPGYRGPDDKCVGFKQLTKVCGDPPTTRCKFENAPGAGANRECALAPRSRKPRKEPS